MHEVDLLFRQLLLIDGTNAEPSYGDLAVDGDRIVAIGHLSESYRGRTTITAGEGGVGKNWALCPGFIDVHSHDDFAALLTPELSFKLTQGVTSEIVGNCGIGAAPRPGADDWLRRLHPEAELEQFSGYGAYFEALAHARPSLNIAVLAGHGALRNQVMATRRGEAQGCSHETSAQGTSAQGRGGHGKSAQGKGGHRASEHGQGGQTGSAQLSAAEEKQLCALLDEALEAGVLGLSTGLIYEPGCHASEAELVALARRMQGRQALYTTHLRNEADGLLDAVQEAVRVCEAAGVGLQLSHHKAHGRNNWGRVEESLALIDSAAQAGLDIALDLYPYSAGSTILQAIVDRGGLDDSPEMGNLRAEDLVLSSVPGFATWEGRSLAELGSEWGLDRKQTALRVLERAADTWVIVHAMSEKDVRRVLCHPRAMLGSDGLPTSGRPHPRLWGSFPRVLGHYVREEGVLGLSAAVHKMSGLPARRFGLVGRGELQVGNFADLVLFDPEQVGAGNSFEQPQLPALGICGVWVNGERTVESGRHLGTRAGRALRWACG